MKDEEESFISRLSVFVLSVLRDVWLVWLALAVLTTLPYVAAALRTPTGYMFSGVLTAYDDTFTYFAWMRQSADGHLLMCDLFTSEPQPCEFFLSLWLYAMSGGLGWLVFALKTRGNLFVATAASGSVDLNLPEAFAFRSVFSQ